MDALTHATTVPQPLAWAIVAGHCPVLMSDTRPDMRHEGTLIGIHASRTHGEAKGECWRSVPVPASRELVFGALIGVARLVGTIRADKYQPSWVFHRVQGRSSAIVETLSYEQCQRIAPWWRSGSKWGLLLAEAVLLPEPIPMRGAGGLWRQDPKALGDRAPRKRRDREQGP